MNRELKAEDDEKVAKQVDAVTALVVLVVVVVVVEFIRRLEEVEVLALEMILFIVVIVDSKEDVLCLGRLAPLAGLATPVHCFDPNDNESVRFNRTTL